MPNTVDYVPFATGGSANVMPQATYLTDAPDGVVPGLADPTFANKAWRQASMIAAAVANFISDELNISVLDDGNLTALTANLTDAIGAAAAANMTVGLETVRVANSYTVQSTDGGSLFYGSTTNAVSNFTLSSALPLKARIAIGQNAGYATNLIIPSGITVYGMGAQWTNTTITMPATTLGEEILVLSYTSANQFLIESVTPTTANALGITYAPGGVAGDARNLAINYASATTLTITADEILAKSALGGIPFAIPSLNVTLNVGTTGLNGMDTGSPSASADLSVYAITGSGETPGVIACLGSVSNGTIYTGSHLPSGYTASALIGSYRMNSSAQFNSFNQRGNFILLGSQITVLSGGSAAGPTAISLSSATPANAKSVSGILQITATSASASFAVESVSGGAQTASLTGYSASNIADDFSDVPLITPQQFYYTYNGGGSGSIFISAYRI